MARRRWEFVLDDGRHVVELEHGYFLGTRKFRIDGIMSIQRGRPFANHTGDYRFRVGTYDAILRIDTNGLTYSYDVLVNGRSIDPHARPTRPFADPKVAAVLGAVFLVLGVPIVAWAANTAYNEYRLSNDGAVATGTLTVRTRTSGRYGPNYTLGYEFAVERRRYEGSGEVSERTYIRSEIGDRFEITYVRSDPTVNRFSGADDLPAALAGAVAGAFLTVLGGALLVPALMQLDLYRTLPQRGVATCAVVVRAKDDFERTSGHVVTLEYAYDDDEGKERRGRTRPLFPREAAKYPVGSKLRVLFDPRRPARSAWEEDLQG